MGTQRKYLTKEEEIEVANLYKEGVPITEICSKYGISERIPASKYKKIFNTGPLVKRVKLSEEDKQFLADNYQYREDNTWLLEKFGITNATLVVAVRKQKGRTLKPLRGNERYFETIDTELKAYFLGWLFGDGNLITPAGGSKGGVSACIRDYDAQIVNKLKEELGCESSVYMGPIRGVMFCNFKYYSYVMMADLQNLGMEHRKSLTMPNVIPNVPKEFRGHFIRGYHDADGSCNPFQKTPEGGYLRTRVSICGTEAFLEGIAEELELKNYYIGPMKPGQEESIWRLNFASKKALQTFYDRCYKDSTFHLQRKLDKLEPYL